MTDNERLARWQGPAFGEPPNEYYEMPDYLNDDAAAMSLLDTLVEKGFRYLCYGESGRTELVVLQGSVEKVHTVKPTRREASIAAVLEVVKRELGADEASCLEVARKEWRDGINA